MRSAAVLEEIDPLPGAERKPPPDQRNRKLRLRQRCAQVSRHVIRPLLVMLVGVRILGRDAAEISFKIRFGRRRRILLDEQRRGCVTAKDGEQTLGHLLVRDPAHDLRSHLQQPLLVRVDKDPKIGFLAHASRYGDALARGEILAPAKSVGQMRQVIFNDYVNASLCALFMVVVAAIVFYGLKAVAEARRSDMPTTREVADAMA